MKSYIVGKVQRKVNALDAIENGSDHLCHLFESLIEREMKRGYVLHTWKFNRIIRDGTDSEEVDETIIAVFHLANGGKGEGK